MPTNGIEPKLRCDYCTYVAKSPTGCAAHERFCEQNPNRLTSGPKPGETLKRATAWATKRRGTFTVHDLGDAMGMKRAGAQSVVVKLVEHGVLNRVSNGHYRITNPKALASALPKTRGRIAGHGERFSDEIIVEAIRRATDKTGAPVKAADLRAELGMALDATGALSHAVRRAIRRGQVVSPSFGRYALPKHSKRNGNGHAVVPVVVDDPDLAEVVSPRRSIRAQLVQDNMLGGALTALGYRGNPRILLEWIDVTRELLNDGK